MSTVLPDATDPAWLADARARAAALDAEDPLADFRARFNLPRHHDGAEQIYLVGNSLGLQPRAARDAVITELDRWAGLGVAGHFTGPTAWAPFHEALAEPMATIVGARPTEVVMMNALTVNLHLLMVSFYRPTPGRHKILIEEHAFPSDHFAVESQIRQRGFDPAASVVLVSPRAGEHLVHPDDIAAAITEHGPELALVLLPGVQYYTGQVMPIGSITAQAHAVGAMAGFDLAHAVGNIELALHDDDVDFAAWCTYKYLNCGPGAVGGAYVHERFHGDPTLPKLTGWWGTRSATRFEMATEFDADPTVDSWQLSNAPILAMAPLGPALDLVLEAGGMPALRAKSRHQLAFFDQLLDDHFAGRVENISPRPFTDRGCQCALRITPSDIDGRAVFEALEAAGVACDWRYPDVIRVAPVPLYNTFADIAGFVAILDRLLR